MIRTAMSLVGLGMVLALALCSGPLPASAQQQSLTVRGSDGGDCTRAPLHGRWDGSVCRLNSLALTQAHALNIVGGATVEAESGGASFGTIAIADHSQLIIGRESRQPQAGTQFVNIGSIVIVPSPGSASPGLSNYATIDNQGVVFNASRNGRGGIVNNFGFINNSGQITNNGFLHNSGPNVQTTKARIRMVNGGILSTQNGRLENLGEIFGRVVGPCSGDCFNRALTSLQSIR